MSADALLMSVPEAAVLLGVSRSKGYALARSHLIPTVDLGGVTKVPKAGLLAWIATATTDVEPPESDRIILTRRRR